ncbi:MAG: hypothetical protein ACOY0T_05410 [Myxococcota bacterium]
MVTRSALRALTFSLLVACDRDFSTPTRGHSATEDFQEFGAPGGGNTSQPSAGQGGSTEQPNPPNCLPSCAGAFADTNAAGKIDVEPEPHTAAGSGGMLEPSGSGGKIASGAGGALPTVSAGGTLPNIGGSLSSAGAAAGALPNTGGALASGGTSSSAGGAAATLPNAGGALATGGTSSSAGGTLASGGTSSSAGGTLASGGTSSSAGGTLATGGTSSSAGGTLATGGASSSAGGTLATGGASAGTSGSAGAGATPGCGTMSCTPENSCGPVAITTCGAPTFSASPGANYGSVQCPDQVVVYNANPPRSGKRLLSMWRWRGPTLTELTCPEARVESSLYAKTTSGPASLVGTEVYVGVWRASDSVCVLTGAGEKPYVVPSIVLAEVRVTVTATLRGIKQPVEAGFWHICN